MTPETRTELIQEAQSWQATEARVRSFAVATADDLDTAARWVKAAKASWKALEDKRKGITRPLLEAKNAADALFKPSQDALLGIEQHLKSEIANYHARIERERAAVMTAAAVSIARDEIPTAIVPEAARVEGITVKEYWDFDVIDPDAVPRELCSPDPEKIRAMIWYADTPHKPPQDIPGVRFFLKGRVTVR